MIAIDMEMPESCVRCFTKGLRGLVGCELLTDDIGIHVGIRHPDCPLKEIKKCKKCLSTQYVPVCADGERRE